MSIAQALDRWYSEKAKRDTEERKAHKNGSPLGPSSLGDCLRKQAFLLAGLEPLPLAPEQVRVFELGHQRGAALEEAAKELWPDAKTQVPVSIPMGKYTLRGTCDLWIPSERLVVDFKTIGAFGAGLLETEGVSEEYKLQVHAYRWDLALQVSKWTADDQFDRTTHEDYARRVRCVVVYEVKDSDSRKGVKAGQLREHEVPWTEELEERYQTRLRELEGLLIRKDQGTLDPYVVPELPLEANGKMNWKCRGYCSVGVERGRCYEKR